MQAAVAALALLLVYWGALRGYLRDQHYQEHFVYLWVFLALALSRTLRGPFRSHFGFASWRDRGAVGLVLLASLVLAASGRIGSSTGMRVSLVFALTGIGLLVVAGWGTRRCLLHGLLLQLCLGVPYAVYLPLTTWMQWGVVALLSLPPRLGLADYTITSTVLEFPHYHLAITPDCSGFGQLLTFLGIAALGVLGSARRAGSAVAMLLLAVVLAWLSNLGRVGFFVALVGLGWTRAVDDEWLHALLGFLVFLPFVTLLVAVLLKTHVPRPAATGITPAPGRVPVVLAVVPLLLAHAASFHGEGGTAEAPAYFAAIESPPDHQLVMRGPTEASDRFAYDTPWLVNARFENADGAYFDLLHYTTRSSGHLCVHQIAACLYAPGQRVTYVAPVEIDGKAWWRIALDRDEPDASAHVYFAFEIGGRRFDDSVATQWEVVRQRLLGGSWEVRLSRVVMPGALPAEPTPYATKVLTWLGNLTGTP